MALLIVGNYIFLALHWLGWQMDYKCGDGFWVLEFRPTDNDRIMSLKGIYSGIYCDMYYYAGFTCVLAVLWIMHTLEDDKEQKESKKNMDVITR